MSTTLRKPRVKRCEVLNLCRICDDVDALFVLSLQKRNLSEGLPDSRRLSKPSLISIPSFCSAEIYFHRACVSFTCVLQFNDSICNILFLCNKIVFSISVSTYTKGEQMVPVLNEIGVHCSVFGNHDFGNFILSVI